VKKKKKRTGKRGAGETIASLKTSGVPGNTGDLRFRGGRRLAEEEWREEDEGKK